MGRSLQLPVAPVAKLKIIPPVSKGGTNSTNPASAAQQLGLVSRLSLGLAGGIALAGVDGKLSQDVLPTSVITGPTLEGPLEVYIGQTCVYTITNYDISTVYTLTATGGIVSRNGNVVTFVAPATVQTVTMTLNNRTIEINIRATAPVRPTITSPVFNASNVISGSIATSSTYALSSGTGTHLSSDWQVATDAAFTNVVASTSNDTVNKTSYLLPSLVENTQYFVRVRYRDSVLGYSEWSQTSSFKTRVTYGNYTEEAVISNSDRASSDQVGGLRKIAMTPDGTRVVLSTSTKTGTYSNQGAVYVFLRTGNTWTQEQKITHTATASTEAFGHSVAITSDGSRIAVGVPGRTNTQSNQGAVYIFSRAGTTWTQEALLYHGDPTSTNSFGASVSLDASGTRLVAGAHLKTDTQTNEGAVYVFTRTNTTWAQEAKVSPPVPTSTGWFGNSVSMSADGLRFVSVGKPAQSAHIYLRNGTTWSLEATVATTGYTSPNANYFVRTAISDNGDRVALGLWFSTSTVTAQGLVLVYSRTGSVWTQETVLTLTSPVAYDQFGSDVSFNSDGSILAVGCNKRTVTLTAQGAVFVYVRNNTTWTLRNTYVGSTAIANGLFGDGVSISDDGTRMAVGSPSVTVSSIAQAGAGYIFS